MEALKRDLNLCISTVSIYRYTYIVVFSDVKRLTRQKNEESEYIYICIHYVLICNQCKFQISMVLCVYWMCSMTYCSIFYQSSPEIKNDSFVLN